MTQTKLCPACRGSYETTASVPAMIVPAEIDDARLTVKGFRVLAHLSRRAAEDAQAGFTVTQILLATRLTYQGAQAALNELVIAGLAVRECRPRTGALYRLAGKEVHRD